ncbi:MAG: hypothetical protein AAF125_03525 [Chloroflexota bacterium]
MTPYSIEQLAPDLLFIRWHGNPSNREGLQFAADLAAYYDAADAPVYTLADLSGGFISDMGVIAHLSGLSRHEHHGGGVTFGGDYRADVFVGMYERMAHPTDNRNWYPTIAEAIQELERRVPGVTAELNWDQVLAEPQ